MERRRVGGILLTRDLLPDPCPVDSTVRKSNSESAHLSAEVSSSRAFDIDSTIPLHIFYFHCRGIQLNLGIEDQNELTDNWTELSPTPQIINPVQVLIIIY